MKRKYRLAVYLFAAALPAGGLASAGDAPPPLATIAYVRNGSLWVKDLPDGRHRWLAGGGRISDPAWSPSGKWLAFLRAGRLEVIRGTRREVMAIARPGKDGEFAWSPVEDRLAFKDGSGNIAVAGPTGGGRKLLARGACDFAWSPDGRWLAYKVWDEAADTIWRIRLDGGDRTLVHDNREDRTSGFELAGWSPDGRSILFWPDDSFSVSTLFDGMPLLAVDERGKTRDVTPEPMLLRPLPLAPADGSLFLSLGWYRDTGAGKRIARIGPGPGSCTYLTEVGQSAVDPDPSPDGTRVAFAMSPDTESRIDIPRRIWVMNADGSGKLRLTDDPLYQDDRPRWLPDGNHLVFQRAGGLWLIGADGTGLRMIDDELALPHSHGMVERDAFAIRPRRG